MGGEGGGRQVERARETVRGTAESNKKYEAPPDEY